MFDNQKKNILIYFPSCGMGGSTLYLSQYISVFKKKNYEIICVCRRKDLGTDFLENLGAKIVFIHFPLSLSLSASEKHNRFSMKSIVIDLSKFIFGFFVSIYCNLKFKPKLIVIGEFTLTQIILSNSFYKKKTEVITIVQTTITEIRWKKKLVIAALKRVNKIIGITNLHICNLPFYEKQFVIHNAISTSSKCSKKKEDIDLNGHIVTFVGGVSQIKGTYEFIQIAKEMNSLRTDIKFLILGNFNKNFSFKKIFGTSDAEFDYNKKIFDYIAVNNLQNILFVGETPFVEYYLSKSLVLINANSFPHFSRPILEAWQKGVLVVSVKDEFTNYMNGNTESIVFINAKRTKETAELILELIFSNIKRRIITKNGFINFKKNYSSDIVVSEINKILFKN